MFRFLSFIKLQLTTHAKLTLLYSVSTWFPLLLCVASLNAQQTTVYDIVFRNKTVGVAYASASYNGAAYRYGIETHVAARFIYKISVDVTLINYYEDGVLKEASLNKRINGSEKTNNQIKWLNGSYLIASEESSASYLQDKIGSSVALLYFAEPTNIHRVFSETYLNYLPVTKTSDGSYSLTLPDGKVNSFQYQNGVCTRIVIDTSLGKVILSLHPNNSNKI